MFALTEGGGTLWRALLCGGGAASVAQLAAFITGYTVRGRLKCFIETHKTSFRLRRLREGEDIP